MDTPTLGPAKAVSTGVFGALSILIVTVLGAFGVAVDPALAQALTVVLGAAAAYFTPTTVR